MSPARRPIDDRFWEKVDKDGPIHPYDPWLGVCWLWTGSHNPSGYGHIWLNGRLVPAHQVALMLAGRPVNPGQEACHSCDNPPCVNEAHLSPGTRSDNQRESVRKRRNGAVTKPHRVPRGDRTGSRLHPERRPRGEGHPNHTLTDREIASVRYLVDGGVSRSLVARAFGVSLSAVSLWCLGKLRRPAA